MPWGIHHRYTRFVRYVMCIAFLLSILHGLKYIFSLSESISECAWYAGLCRTCRDCNDDHVSIFSVLKKKKSRIKLDLENIVGVTRR